MRSTRTYSPRTFIADPMNRMRTTPIIFYSAMGLEGGGGNGAPAPGAAPGGAPTPGAQPGSQGNGQGGFRGTFFQNVPDEVWSQIEPHVGNINQHVTQLQQRYAPFKDYRDEDLQGLANFSTAFDRDPVGQWLRIASMLQSSGKLDEELDIDHLTALVTGKMPDQQPVAPQSDGDMPAWAQQLKQQLDKLEGGFTQSQTQTRQQVEDAVLNRQLTAMKTGLKNAGFGDDDVSQEQLLSAYIAHRGNAQGALQSFVNMRNAMLKGYVKQAGDPTKMDPANPGNPTDLDLPNGAPQVRASRGGRTPRGSAISPQTKAAAEQFLRGRQGSQ